MLIGSGKDTVAHCFFLGMINNSLCVADSWQCYMRTWIIH